MKDCRNCKYFKDDYCILCKEKREINVAFECDNYSDKLNGDDLK